MVFWFSGNKLCFTHKGTNACKEVVFPIEQPIFSVYHRPLENLIFVSLFDTEHHLSNQPNNVFAVDDRTGKIVWRINEDEKTRFPHFRNRPIMKYMYFAENEINGKACVYDVYYQVAWEINSETGCIERFIPESGFK